MTNTGIGAVVLPVCDPSMKPGFNFTFTVLMIPILAYHTVNSDKPSELFTATLEAIYIDSTTNERELELTPGYFGTINGIIRQVDYASGWGVHTRTRAGERHACDVLHPDVPMDQPWVAFVERGGCPFDVKIRNAGLLANASAVVVYNDDSNRTMAVMTHTGKYVHIYLCKKVLLILIRLVHAVVSSHGVT